MCKEWGVKMRFYTPYMNGVEMEGRKMGDKNRREKRWGGFNHGQ